MRINTLVTKALHGAGFELRRIAEDAAATRFVTTGGAAISATASRSQKAAGMARPHGVGHRLRRYLVFTLLLTALGAGAWTWLSRLTVRLPRLGVQNILHRHRRHRLSVAADARSGKQQFSAEVVRNGLGQISAQIARDRSAPAQRRLSCYGTCKRQ